MVTLEEPAGRRQRRAYRPRQRAPKPEGQIPVPSCKGVPQSPHRITVRVSDIIHRVHSSADTHHLTYYNTSHRLGSTPEAVKVNACLANSLSSLNGLPNDEASQKTPVLPTAPCSFHKIQT